LRASRHCDRAVARFLPSTIRNPIKSYLYDFEQNTPSMAAISQGGRSSTFLVQLSPGSVSTYCSFLFVCLFIYAYRFLSCWRCRTTFSRHSHLHVQYTIRDWSICTSRYNRLTVRILLTKHPGLNYSPLHSSGTNDWPCNNPLGCQLLSLHNDTSLLETFTRAETRPEPRVESFHSIIRSV